MTTGPTPDFALMALIARELATEISTREQILDRYSEYLDEARLKDLEANPYFKRVLGDYIKEWHALSSTNKRLAFYAATALEEKLPGLAHSMGDTRSEFTDRINAAKLFRDLAGIAPPSPGAGAQQGPGFSISINFGDRKIAVEAQTQAP